MSGPARKPDEMKILTGTWRDDRDGDPSKAVIADGEPIPPAHLRGESLEFWHQVVPDLAKNGIAKARDAAELAMMCEWWARYRRFSRRLDRMPNSAKALYSATVQVGICWTNFDKIAQRFGLTPSDRAKLRVADREKKPAQVLSRKRG